MSSVFSYCSIQPFSGMTHIAGPAVHKNAAPVITADTGSTHTTACSNKAPDLKHSTTLKTSMGCKFSNWCPLLNPPPPKKKEGFVNCKLCRLVLSDQHCSVPNSQRQSAVFCWRWKKKEKATQGPPAPPRSLASSFQLINILPQSKSAFSLHVYTHKA